MPKQQGGLKLDFPKRFLWGASVSAHQVEGGQHNQWSVWELENARSLATQAPYHYSDLDNWADIKKLATTPANYISGQAVKHAQNYAADFSLLKQMNMNAFRFSVEWSRLEPEDGAWNLDAVAYYKDYFKQLRMRGIEPVVTLFHFTLPIWFSEYGGFEKRANVKYFTRFAQKVIGTFGTEFKYVITINEPEVYAFESYHKGNWPPQVTSFRRARRVYNNLAYAHKKVAEAIHEKGRKHKVAVAKNMSFDYPGDDAKLTVWSASFSGWLKDTHWLKKVARHCDFLGINYYFSNRYYGYRVHNPNEQLSDMGWDMQPGNLQYVIEHTHERYNLPIMVTENGLADAGDKQRQWWIAQSVLAMQRAMKNGAEVIGYLHWSLLDNFEWDKGRWPRFGLAEVNYRTMQRTLRPSARWLGGIIKKIRGL